MYVIRLILPFDVILVHEQEFPDKVSAQKLADDLPGNFEPVPVYEIDHTKAIITIPTKKVKKNEN